jgi:hypothetical protein
LSVQEQATPDNKRFSSEAYDPAEVVATRAAVAEENRQGELEWAVADDCAADDAV